MNQKAVDSFAQWVGRRAIAITILFSGVLLVLAMLGIAQRAGAAGRLALFNLDAENSAPTFLSAGVVWLAVALLAVAVRAQAFPRIGLRFAALLAWVALDDGIAIHERLERSSGIDWQILYIPLLLIGAALGVQLLRRLKGRDRRRFLVGSALWAVALVLEPIQHWGGSPIDTYDVWMITEEVLEMAGGIAFMSLGLFAISDRIDTQSDYDDGRYSGEYR